jgi:hypothetical protein
MKFSRILFTLAAFFALVSCDKDFNEIGADIVGDDHFEFALYDEASVVANTISTGAVQSNNQDINPLGIYNNPVFGMTLADFVTQLEMATVNPDFVTIDNPPAIDSVVLSIPYFSRRTSTDADGTRYYELDSIYGPNNGAMKLSVYESGYFLRDLDHNEQGAQQVQRYYTDQAAEISAVKNPDRLNNSMLNSQNDMFSFSPDEIIETVEDNNGDEKNNRLVPAMRLHLSKAFFEEKLFNAPAGALQNNNAFKNYFRGLYFSVESLGGPSQMALLNFRGGTIKVYYKMDRRITQGTVSQDDDEIVRDQYNWTMNLRGNCVSLVTQTPSATYLSGLNQAFSPGIGHDNLFVMGGQGSVAVIDLFGSADANDDGVPDELEYIREQKWLINEASLTFHINQDIMSPGDLTQAAEPYRVYLYNVKNRTPLIDYYYDTTTGSLGVKRGHGGYIKKNETGRGTEYKIRITEHVKALVKGDSSNVRLGLAVTQTIANIGMAKQKLPNPTSTQLNEFVPAASVMHPIGTVLYGTGPSVPEDKRLKLKIYYTKPN